MYNKENKTGSQKNGQMMHTETGQNLKILSYIAEGSSFEVYRVDLEGKDYALVWYKDTYLYYLDKLEKREKFLASLRMSIARAPGDQFLWPIYFVQSQEGHFGYVINLRQKGYYPMDDYYWGTRKYYSFRAILNTAQEIVKGFNALNESGFCYQKLNMSDFCIKAENSEDVSVLFCNYDSFAAENLDALGYYGFMAPEVVLGKTLPCAQTNNYSLAVIFFHLFMNGHPLEGKMTLEKFQIITRDVEKRMYGSEPLFCYDPEDDSNRPNPHVHQSVIKRWSIYPKFFREAFCRSFTSGLNDVEKRLSPPEWSIVIANLQNSLIKVGDWERFVDFQDMASFPAGSALLRLKNMNRESLLAVANGSNLYAYQINQSSTDSETVVAKFRSNKKNPGIIAIKNESESEWSVTMPDGADQKLPKGGVTPIVKGLVLQFGESKAEVVFARES